MKPKYVYFLKPKNMDGPIKIGCSDIPVNRLMAFAVWSPFPLELIGSAVGTLRDEQFLHRCFADSHSHSEWFHSTPALRAMIQKAVVSGTIEAVKADLVEVRSVRKGRPPRSENDKLRSSYASRVRRTQQRLRKNGEDSCWYAPDDVSRIISRWSGYARSPAVIPTQSEMSRLDEYLSDPIKHSLVPSWKRRKDPICIPIFPVDEVAA